MKKTKKDTKIQAPVGKITGRSGQKKTPQPANAEEIRKELCKQIKIVK